MDEISSRDCTRRLAPKLGVPAALSTHEFFLLATVLDAHVRLPGLVENKERKVCALRHWVRGIDQALSYGMTC